MTDQTATIQKGLTVPLALIKDDLKAMIARRWGINPDAILDIAVADTAVGPNLYATLAQEPIEERPTNKK